LPNPGEPESNEATSVDRSATVIDSAPIEQLVASSTIDIAEALNASGSRWQLYKAMLAVLVALFVVGAFAVVSSAPAVSPIAAFIVTAGAVIILGAMTVHGLQSSTVSLDYDLSSESQRFEALRNAFGAVASCNRVWRIPLERQEADWKEMRGSRGYRANTISPREQTATCKSNVEFLQLTLERRLYISPQTPSS
jgi:hypothetical protein